MDTLFIYVCILSMWLMIFGAGIFYLSFLHSKNTIHSLYFLTASLFVAIVTWLGAGYSLAFSQENPWLGNFHWSIFNTASILAASTIENSQVLLQLCFCLYAVIMLIGGVFERITIISFLFFLPLWILLVYAPLAHWIWAENGWLHQMGVLDFSGALVVHLSAGSSSYLLAALVGNRITQKEEVESQPIFLFMGTLFITFGWFGFNSGPVGELNQHTTIILINTLICMAFGGLGWECCSYYFARKLSFTSFLNGIITGLVASTATVGYVSPLSSLLLAFGISATCKWIIETILPYFKIDDPVDTFGMNAIGGALSALATGIFASNVINPEGANGLINGNLWLLLTQSFAIVITVLLSVSVTWILFQLISAFIPMKVNPEQEKKGLDQEFF